MPSIFNDAVDSLMPGQDPGYPTGVSERDIDGADDATPHDVDLKYLKAFYAGNTESEVSMDRLNEHFDVDCSSEMAGELDELVGAADWQKVKFVDKWLEALRGTLEDLEG